MVGANDLIRQLPSADWEELERLLKAFGAAWQRGDRPVLEEYLRRGPASNPLLLVELVHLDLEFRLKAGEPARVETYLERYPDLARVPGALPDLLAAEYDLRRRREPGLMPREYVSRFPHY